MGEEAASGIDRMGSDGYGEARAVGGAGDRLSALMAMGAASVTPGVNCPSTSPSRCGAPSQCRFCARCFFPAEAELLARGDTFVLDSAGGASDRVAALPSFDHAETPARLTART